MTFQPPFPPGELLQGPHEADRGRGEAIYCDVHQLGEAEQELEPPGPRQERRTAPGWRTYHKIEDFEDTLYQESG